MAHRKCSICGKAIILVPSAEERSRKTGKAPAYYLSLFSAHADCQINKRNDDVRELIRRNHDQA